MDVDTQQEDADPALWSVDQICDFLCKDRTWSSHRPHAKFPDPIKLEAWLKQEAVDGATFLLEVDRLMIKELLGATLGELSTLLEAQRILRGRSASYQASGASNTIARSTTTSGTQLSQQELIQAPIPLAQAVHGQQEKQPLEPQNISYVTDVSGHKRRRIAPTFVASSNDPFRANAFRKTQLSTESTVRDRANGDEEEMSVDDDDDEDSAGDEDSSTPTVSLDGAEEDVLDEDDEYGYLAHWQHQEDDELLPVYGESVSEDLSDSFVEELDEEKREDDEIAVQAQGLTKGDILRIIGEQVIAYEEEWKAKKKPKRDAMEWKIWNEGKSMEDRQRRSRIARDHVKYLHARYLEIYKKLASMQVSESELRRLCEGFQMTIEDKLDTKHRIDVWDSAESPIKPSIRLVAQRKVKRQTLAKDADDVSIDLSSEEEFVMENDPPVSPPSSPPVQITDDAGELDTFHAKDMNNSPTEDGDALPVRSASDIDQTVPVDSAKPSGIIDLAVSSPQIAALSSQSSTGAESPSFDFKSHDFGIQLPHVAVRTSWEKDAKGMSADPLKDSDFNVRNWSTAMLNYTEDIKRIMIKILFLPEELNIEALVSYIRDSETLTNDIFILMDNFSGPGQYDFGESSAQPEILVELGKLFLCWWYRNSLPMDLSSGVLYNLGATEREALRTLAQAPYYCLTNRQDEFVQHATDFVGYCQRVIQEKDRRATDVQGKSIIEISSDDLDDDSDEHSLIAPDPGSAGNEQSTIDLDDQTEMSARLHTETPDIVELPEMPRPRPVTMRKRTVDISQSAKKKREQAQTRFEEVRRRTERALTHVQSGSSEICINPGKADDEPFIYINDHLSRSIQQHQIDGVRFMWTQVTEVGDNAMPGGLLAHSMGLGKTLQALTLISTIAEAGKTQEIKRSIPRELRRIKAMILCPAGLVSNWETEFTRWIPNTTLAYQAVGELQACRSYEALPLLKDRIKYWYEEGGVLLMGFERFRTLIVGHKRQKLNTESGVDEQVRNMLVDGPNLVILDEAHKIKNSTTGIRQAVDLIKTPIRIAMTGSPLSNNLMEYFDLMDWVCPGYLGSRIEFAAYFEEVIRAGNFAESTSEEIGRAQAMQKLLEHDCAPKVHKRDREVLKQQIKDKTEFIITVPLTALQKRIYEVYVEYLTSQTSRMSKDGARAANTSYLGWVGDLTRVCSHPMVFTKSDAWLELEQLGDDNIPGKAAAVQYELDNATNPFGMTADPAELKARLAMLGKVKEALSSVSDPQAPKHSFRASILLDILEESIKVGDQILVFTHSLKLLDWLKDLLGSRGLRALTIDGRTEIAERVKLIDGFNRGSHPIALLSTKAGALGFNITGANRAVIMDFSHNPQWEIQAASRVWRIGQEKEVFIYRLVSGGTHEDKLLNNAISKTQLAHKVVKDKNPENMAIKNMKYIERLTDIEQKDTSQFLGMDKVLDKIMLEQLNGQDRGIRAVRTTDQLEMERDVQWTEEQQKAMLEESKRRREDQARAKQLLAAAPRPPATIVRLRQPEIIDLCDSDPVEPPEDMAVAGYTAPVANMGMGDMKASIETESRSESNVPSEGQHGAGRASERQTPLNLTSGGPVQATNNPGPLKYTEGPFALNIQNAPSQPSTDPRVRPPKLNMRYGPNPAKAGGKRSTPDRGSDESIAVRGAASRAAPMAQQATSAVSVISKPTDRDALGPAPPKVAFTPAEQARVPTGPKAMVENAATKNPRSDVDRIEVSNNRMDRSRNRSRSPRHNLPDGGPHRGRQDTSGSRPNSRPSSADRDPRLIHYEPRGRGNGQGRYDSYRPDTTRPETEG